MATVTVDLGKSQKVLEAMSGRQAEQILERSLQEASLFGERAVAERTPVRTGGLRASIHAQRIRTLLWRIFSPLIYAPAVEDGSRPHEILPRHGKYLVFVRGGVRVFARKVHHPGTKGHQMFAKSVPIIAGTIPNIVDRQLRAGLPQ